tara:strand:+ start:170 stop:454 length:285 start_codon:yes stop_codon:yes gene_type:complete
MKALKNIAWFFKELMYLWSDKPSFFSKKRVESSIAFIIAQAGMIWYLVTHMDTMDIYDFLMWAGAEFLIAGYTISHIQKEKKSAKINLPNINKN